MYNLFVVVVVYYLLLYINKLFDILSRVHCTLDLSSGEMTFSCDKQDLLHNANSVTNSQTCHEITDYSEFVVKLTANHGTKLFPTVVTTPSTETLVNFDFTPKENCRSLSSTFISDIRCVESTIPLCPRRLELMIYFESQWVRQVPQSPKYDIGHTTGDGGALTVSTGEEVEQGVSITLPQEDIVMDLVEISEDWKLMDFHIQTLDALCAVCSHRNVTLARSITTFIDSPQLLRCLQVSLLAFHGEMKL